MNTTTDLANEALAYLGEGKISDIDDTGNRLARVARQFMRTTIDEILRSHRWNCAIKRATLSRVPGSPLGEVYPYEYQLPTGCLRVLDVNGETWEYGSEYHEVEGQRLLTHADAVVIRYIKYIGPEAMDPLLREAVATKLAMKIAVPLAANLDLQQRMAALHERVVRKAAHIDAIETGSRENGGLRRLVERSDLVRSRYGYGARRDPLRYNLPF